MVLITVVVSGGSRRITETFEYTQTVKYPLLEGTSSMVKGQRSAWPGTLESVMTLSGKPSE